MVIGIVVPEDLTDLINDRVGIRTSRAANDDYNFLIGNGMTDAKESSLRVLLSIISHC